MEWRGMRILAAMLLLTLLPACIARTAVGIVTLPVRAVGAGVDAVTTSQSEADRKRGRAIREEEERLGREDRLREKRERALLEGDRPGEDE